MQDNSYENFSNNTCHYGESLLNLFHRIDDIRIDTIPELEDNLIKAQFHIHEASRLLFKVHSEIAPEIEQEINNSKKKIKANYNSWWF